jgi:hypothetical protein
MATPESINRLLAVAATLLDHAAAEVRDAKLEPVRENIDRIGKALPRSSKFSTKSTNYNRNSSPNP